MSKAVVGVSDTQVTELSGALGFRATVSAVELSSQLSTRVSSTITISSQHETSEELTLSTDRLRRFALWRQVEELEFLELQSRLIPFDPSTYGTFRGADATWESLKSCVSLGTRVAATTY